MKQKYLDKLEYNKILEILSSYCKTETGKKLALNLVPSSNKDEVKYMLIQTMEASNLIKRFGNAPMSEIPNIELYLKALDGNGITTISGILDLTYVFKQSYDLKNYFYQKDVIQDDFSSLECYFSMLYSNTSIIEKVSSCIIDSNTIADNASKTLSTIRRKKQNKI